MTPNRTKARLAKTASCCGLLLLPLALSQSAQAAGDPAQGKDVYQEECSDCHSFTPGKNKKGPSFAGVVGRTAGTVPGAKYSDAMKSSKIVWTPDRIDAYIAHPKQVVPGGKMKYDGLDDAKARADVIAFLQTKS